MAQLKTQATGKSVSRFIQGIPDEQMRSDCRALLQLMRQITGYEPKMWGTSIVGFGQYHYRYASGREGDWFLTGFAPRKNNLTIYLMTGFEPNESLLKNLGTFKKSGSCLYLKKLDDIHLPTLKKLIERSISRLNKSSQEKVL